MKTLSSRKLMRVRAAAKALGLRESTLRAWILRRKIGYTKIGAAVRVPASEVDRLIKVGFVEAREVRD